MWPTHWPQLAREIAEHTSVALAAARTRSVPAWEDATTELVALPYEQVAGVHATMMRELLEELHPDGLAGEDVQAVFERSARTGAAWLPSLHPDTVVAVLTGTLGVSDPDAPKARPDEYLQAGLVVLADLLAARRADPGVYLRRALGEIERAETVEMP
ncbi:hypothetical protein [Rhodococcus indonesiensis]|uniref:hypothetical protein n=1 Tax=Rhodococcus indonesiensis TaxID=3055869 RepID=UPI0039F6F016